MTDTPYFVSQSETARAAASRIDWARLFTSFNGRIDRTAFWIGFAILFAAGAAVQAGVFMAVNGSDVEIASLVASAAFIYPALALYAKRCHDRGKSAWWLVVLIVPVFNIVWLVWELGLQPSVETEEA